MDRLQLRRKYPKWAHRRDYHKKSRSRSRRRRRRARKKARTEPNTEQMLVMLLNQLLRPATPAKKHGENVLTGYADTVKPDLLPPVRSREQHRRWAAERQGPGGGGAASGAAAGYIPFYPHRPNAPGRAPMPT